MLKSNENKKYAWTVATAGLFGVIGLLIISLVRGVIKAAKRYPKAFSLICFAFFAFICIYEFLFTQKWNMRFTIICIAAALVINSLTTKKANRQ